MRILGISAFYHDSAAALVVDGRIVAAVQEERFTRVKQDAGFPRHAIDYCLAAGGVGLDQVDYVVFYEKPFLKFERLLETYVGFAPRGLTSFATAVPIWIREKLFQKDMLARGRPPRWRSATAGSSRSSRSCTSRIRSGCFIRPSRTTSASRSIPASTS
jgi:carbamoyltransferase